MTKSRWFQVLASLAILASFVCGQAMAEDQEHFQLRIHRQKIQKHARGRRSEFGTRPLQIQSCPPAFPTCANIPTADLYTVFAGLGIMPQQDASQFGSTGYVYDEWPCDPANYGGGSPSVGCPYATIQGESENDGSGVFSGGLVIGYPGYSIQFAGDTNLANGDPPCYYNSAPHLTDGLPPFCTQIVNFWEDDTTDTTDELYQTIEVTQGTSVIFDSGVIDWGQNEGGPLEYQEWIDVLFGTLGQPGVVNGKAVKNNGMCLAANSVIISNEFGSNYASGKTCSQPVPGAAKVTIITYIGEAAPHQTVKINKCGAGGTSACTLTQSFNIFFTDDYETYY